MSTAASIIQNTPILGKMFKVNGNDELTSINAWPSIIVMTSFVWLAIAMLLGLSMPVIQYYGLNIFLFEFYTALTLHGAAMTFPFAFSLMVGVSLHRAASCMGRKADGPLVVLYYIFMNVGGLLFTLAVLSGFKISYTVMFPLPVVGAQMGVWPMWSVVLGFTGIALILISMIVLYPVQILSMIFWSEKHEELELSPRTLNDPGMLGMLIAVIVLLVAGLPLLITAASVLLYLYGIFPASWIGWATTPVVFQFVFYIFAHNLMESMAIMIVSAVYGTLPLYLADGTRKLYSDKLANAALWILLITSVTSFFHHFYTMFPALPSTFSFHGNVMSWGTGIGGAFTIFTILATIWKHGLRPEPGVMMILAGFVIYCLDGVTAMIIGNVAMSYHLHGTLWVGGHAMTVLLAMSLMWMGVLYHHYPVMTNRNPDTDKCRSAYRYYFIGGVGLMYTCMVGGAMGVPRRISNWVESGYMGVGVFILIFGLILSYGITMFFVTLSKSREITT